MCCVFVHTNIDNTRRASSPLVTLCGTGAYASGASLATVSFREEFFSETSKSKWAQEEAGVLQATPLFYPALS